MQFVVVVKVVGKVDKLSTEYERSFLLLHLGGQEESAAQKPNEVGINNFGVDGGLTKEYKK